MRITRRELVKYAAVCTVGLLIAGSLISWTVTAAEQKYAKYHHKFVYKKGTGGPGAPDYYFRMTGKDLNDRDTNFSFGYYSKEGIWDTSIPAGCTHPYNVCLVFAGLDPKDPNYLGAEIEISLGKEYEKHVINVPSIVCVPKGLPYGPIITKNVEKPFAHYAIGLAKDYEVTKLPGKPTRRGSSKNEYGHLIKLMSATASPGANRVGPGNADWLSWPKSKDLEGFIVNFTWGFYRGLGSWHSIPGFDPHVHEGDEFLCYVGLDPKRPDYLGAELDFWMGKNQDEKFFIDSPMVTVAPSMVWHAPIVTKKVDQTYGFFLIRRDTGEFYSPKKE